MGQGPPGPLCGPKGPSRGPRSRPKVESGGGPAFRPTEGGPSRRAECLLELTERHAALGPRTGRLGKLLFAGCRCGSFMFPRGPGPTVRTSGRIAPRRDPEDVAVCFAIEAARRRSARVRAVHAWELPCPADGWMPFAVPEVDRADLGGRAGADAVRRPAPVAGGVPANTGPEGRAAVHGGCCLGSGVDADGTARGGSAEPGTRPGRRCGAPRKVSLRCRALTAVSKVSVPGEADGTSLRASPRSNGR